MLKEILESASWSDDAQLVFSEITQIIEKIQYKIGNAKLDARTYQTLEKAKDELEKSLRRM